MIVSTLAMRAINASKLMVAAYPNCFEDSFEIFDLAKLCRKSI